MGQTAVLPPRRKDTYALELHIWCRKFIEECPSGLITLHEFRRHFCDGTVGPGSSEYAEQIFRTLDDNRDDLVDYSEYVTAVSLLIQGTAEEKLRWSFKLYDKDKDGAISRAEMLEIMQAIYKMSLAASLTNVDLQTAEECTERMFTRLDKDRDAVISQQEFVEGALEDAWVRAMLECDPNTVEVPTSARPRQQANLSPTRQQQDPSPTRQQQAYPSPTRQQQDPSPTRQQQDPSPTRQQQDPSPTRQQQDLSPTRQQQDPSPTRQQQDLSPTRQQQDPSPTRQQQDPSPTRQQQDPSPTRQQQDPSPTRQQQDPSPDTEPAAVTDTPGSC